MTNWQLREDRWEEKKKEEEKNKKINRFLKHAKAQPNERIEFHKQEEENKPPRNKHI